MDRSKFAGLDCVDFRSGPGQIGSLEDRIWSSTLPDALASLRRSPFSISPGSSSLHEKSRSGTSPGFSRFFLFLFLRGDGTDELHPDGGRRERRCPPLPKRR